MADPILYSFRRCPYAMRARMALHISGIAIEHREVLLRDKPQAMLAASPKGTVPVLVLANGQVQVVDESLEIMEWALGQSDPDGWLDRRDDALIQQNDGPFKHHLDHYKYHTRYACDPVEHRAACSAILGQLETRLGSEAAWLGGQRMGFTDVAIMPFIRQFANADRAWFDAQTLPRLQAWLNTMIGSDMFIAIMAKHALWVAPGDGDHPV